MKKKTIDKNKWTITEESISENETSFHVPMEHISVLVLGVL